MLMSFGLMPLGILPVTALADEIGAQLAIALSSGALIVILLILFGLVRPLRELRLDALAHAELSPVQAAALVAAGKLTQEDADRLSSSRGKDVRLSTGTGG
jgi:hypothetical protein